MVIVHLMGGLGNQLFQYAAGRQLASRLQTELKLEASGYAKAVDRVYALRHFHIQEHLASTQEIRLFSRHSRVDRVFEKLGLKESYSILKEKPVPNLVPQFFSIQGHVLLRGFWQSEKYFRGIAPLVKKELTLRELLVDKGNTALLQQITNTESVAIHVRRGDYISNQQAREFHGACSEEYYRNAVAFIQSQVKNPSFFIFSDEPDWVAEHFTLDAPVCVVRQNPPEEAHKDLHLMRHCHHFIVANSSFSWWGAWLGDRKEKLVVAPEKWFQTIADDADDSHIIPEAWITL